MSTRSEPQFTKVINVQADGDGEASSFLEGIYGDNLVAEESRFQDVKVTVMESDEDISQNQNRLAESIWSENYTRSNFRGRRGNHIKSESIFSEHKSCIEPPFLKFDSSGVFSRPKRSKFCLHAFIFLW